MNVLMVGAGTIFTINCLGEYTVGLTATDSANKSDKKLGVVALTFLHLKKLGKVKWIGLVATSHAKAKRAQEWIRQGIGMYKNVETELDSLYPMSGTDYKAYETAINEMEKGGIVTIFTPDETHFDIAKYAISHSLHVIIAKPVVLTLSEHNELITLANKHNVLVCGEFHKRFDPIYEDGRNVISSDAFGFVNYFYAYMSQPKYQLDTFKSWLSKKQSDISFYLNSHHVDYLCWCLYKEDGLKAVPVSVYASSSTGVADDYLKVEGIEDTITLVVNFKYLNSDNTFTGVFTSSWVAPNKGEVHSQQRFYCLGSKSEVRIDQAHRGYEICSDYEGYKSKNPLFMNYTPKDGNFVGYNSYGYKSFRGKYSRCNLLVFLKTCQLFNEGNIKVDEKGNLKILNNLVYSETSSLALLQKLIHVTAILEAGRKGLNEQRIIQIIYDASGSSIELK